jgi:hypothetical protein
MLRMIGLGVAILGLVGSGCDGGGGGGDDDSCTLPSGQWSSASSGDGSTCQVNFFTDPEYATYCGGTTGDWHCACGPIVDNPQEFESEDFCDLEPEVRACQAIERCGFPL